jgi:hypothetical protein
MPACLADHYRALAGFGDFLGSANPRYGSAWAQQQTALRPVTALVAGHRGPRGARVSFAVVTRAPQ